MYLFILYVIQHSKLYIYCVFETYFEKIIFRSNIAIQNLSVTQFPLFHFISTNCSADFFMKPDRDPMAVFVNLQLIYVACGCVAKYYMPRVHRVKFQVNTGLRMRFYVNFRFRARVHVPLSHKGKIYRTLKSEREILHIP
jgi:hypothetical protein